MKKSLSIFIIAVSLFQQFAFSQTVKFTYIKASPQINYAVKMMGKGLVKKGYFINSARATYSINLVIDSNKLSHEAYTILPQGKTINIIGGDERGLIYGSLTLAESLRNGTSLGKTNFV